MEQQKYYVFMQKQILIMIGLSLIPGLVYVGLGLFFDLFFVASLWYSSLLLVSLFGWSVYRDFSLHKMSKGELKAWYNKLKIFMYMSFFAWLIVFLLFTAGCQSSNMHYIAVFTQVGASVVASALLVSDKKLFFPILLLLMLPLVVYFLLLGTWYGYILAVFSFILLLVLLYGAHNTYRLIQKNYYHAQHDALTGLFNRRYFLEYMEALNERLQAGNRVATIFLIDLDHFKTINDSLGHDVGDKLLKEVAKRIKQFTKGTHVTIRLGGDEFMIVGKASAREGVDVMYQEVFTKNLMDVIREPYRVDRHRLHISASIGVYQLDAHSSFGNNFIKEVDIAMYEAKAQGRDRVVVFNKDFQEKVSRQLSIEQKLYQALKEKKLIVHYQPQFDKNEKLIGCEALARWHDEELGVLSPAEFVPIAEKTGLILELGSYVLEQTLDTLNSWCEKGYRLESYSINISMKQLLSDKFFKEVEYLFETHFQQKSEHPKICFEITEHVFAEDMAKVIAMMDRLIELGISFSIDDFGTGYSSLSYLSLLPIKEVKIDKSFISRLGESENDIKMISTIIAIAKNFGLSIVAEGVENDEQLRILTWYECDIFQGFYFEKALAQADFEEKYFNARV